MGATTPGGLGRGGMPPMEGGPAPITPGKPAPPSIRPPVDGGKPSIRPPKPPKGDKSPEIFDKLLEGIKKGGFGGQRRPIGGRGDRPLVSRPAPGSNIPLGPDDRPLVDPILTEYGDPRDPDYAEKKRKAFEKKYGSMPKSEPFGTGPVNPRGSGLADGGPRPPRDIGLGGGPGGIPPSFPRGPRDPRTMRGPRKEAVFFGGKPPSAESRRPTKEGPKRGMRKAGPVDTETKNKFEEMLAYMKSFQR